MEMNDSWVVADGDSLKDISRDELLTTIDPRWRAWAENVISSADDNPSYSGTPPPSTARLGPHFSEGSPLCFVASFGRADWVATFLNRGDDALERDSAGLTPFQHAVLAGSSSCARLLLRDPAEASAAFFLGGGALHAAACSRFEREQPREMVEWLLSLGLDPETKDYFGQIALEGSVVYSALWLYFFDSAKPYDKAMDSLHSMPISQHELFESLLVSTPALTLQAINDIQPTLLKHLLTHRNALVESVILNLETKDGRGRGKSKAL